MSSPPRSQATSPSGGPHATLPNSRKRGPGPLPSGSLHKRRKPSTLSATSSSHPLRQTSFPPEETQGGERSPSVESDYTTVTGSQSVAAGTTGGKKRGRKKKDGAESVVSGRGGAEDTASKTGAPDEDVDGEEEEGDGADDDMVAEGGQVDKKVEKENFAILMNAFNLDQSERYNTFRRAKFKKETIRKIVNQTLSQSVPPSVVTTINGFTKVFAGQLIERARTIQQQEHDAAQSYPSPSETQESRTEVDASNTSFAPTQTSSDSTLVSTTKDGYLGPLLPDHIREAFRRYRKNGDGEGAGVGGVSVGLGLPGAGIARTGGRRLFR